MDNDKQSHKASRSCDGVSVIDRYCEVDPYQSLQRATISGMDTITQASRDC